MAYAFSILVLLLTVKYVKSKALERAGEADRVKCCVQTDRIKNLIPALFFTYSITKSVRNIVANGYVYVVVLMQHTRCCTQLFPLCP
jgi:hypothetical protein